MMTAARSREVLAPEPRGVEAPVCDTGSVITDPAEAHAWHAADIVVREPGECLGAGARR
ncbi:hypothetical protein J2X68_002637 [Streptomyces sp. 3330]|uniref:hypothetical protein n=1 Tax=Streptomyces sp. 3330 TaxID=2817755 RepID=UPI00285C20CC|nr:hypothetical protein [Streptomyces sp. 3330]MDR6975949.1 hypothetical protein [Streptomyces sp. 3330]